MKIPITLLILIFCFSSKAQVNGGIKFEQDLNWAQIKEKAKKENKYIFVDTYTTWCGPCKQMEKEIFTQQKVGDFFNKNFLNVKVQIDRTKKDTEEIKKWYNDAKSIENTYKINSYPTYLFLNPNGNLVHEIIGGSENAEEFIEKASAALNPETQYCNLKQEFINGNRDTTFLKLIIATSTSCNDILNTRIYIKSYLKTQKNLFTNQNIQFIATSLESNKDIGYEVILNYPKEVISVIGEKYRNYILNTIAFDEDILPLLRINGKKEISSSGMMANYTGEINKKVDWAAMQLMLNSKYKDRSERLIFDAKTAYYQWTDNLISLNKALIEYTNQSKPVDEDIICKWLNYYLLIGKKEYFADAIKWASAISINKNSTCTKNYAILLYKAGQKEEAIKVILNYKASLKEPEEGLGDLISKMKSGQTID